MNLLTRPDAIIPDKYGPDSVLAMWKDEARKLVVRGGIAFPRDSGPLDAQGFAVVVVRGIEPNDQKAHVVAEWFWNAVTPVFEHDKLLDAGLVRSMVEARSSWGVERYSFFENESDVHTFTRQVRLSTAFQQTPPFFRRAEYGSDREGWGLVWNWLRRRELVVKAGSEVDKLITSSEHQRQIPLGPVGQALASALWALDRRGVHVDAEAKQADPFWRTVPPSD